MTQAITLHQNRPLAPANWGMLREQAAFLVKSGFLPNAIKTPEQALAIMLQGHELDIGPMAALQTINVIQGKPTVSPQLMLALIERSREAEEIDIDDANDEHHATVTMKRRGRARHTATFTMDDARKLGLAGKDNWSKQPKVMLQWRAVAACARVCFPDIILGLYTPDEMGADVGFTDTGEMVIDRGTGEIIEATAEEIPFDDVEPIYATPEPTRDQLTLYQRGIKKADFLGIDVAKWELEGSPTGPQVQQAIDEMIAAVNAKLTPVA